jgi:hypothetical protein
MTMCRPAAWVLLVLAAAPLAGCSKKVPELKAVPVRGHLLQADNTPYQKVMVLVFYPADESAGRTLPSPSTSTSPTDGSFSVECVPGRFKVTLAPISSSQGNPAGGGGGPAANAPKMEDIGALKKYLSASTTPWEVTISDGGTENLELKIQPD